MPDFAQKLFFDAGFDVRGLYDDAGQIEKRIAGMGNFAEATFQKQIARELAKAVNPANFEKEANQARQSILKFSDDAKKIFENTLGANQAKRMFDPIRKESQTLAGQIKQGLSGALGIGNISVGVGIGNLLADIGRGFVNLTKEAIQFSAQFESALKQVQTIADEGFNFDQTRDNIQELASRIPQDILTLTKGLGDIIGSGFSQTAEAMQILEVSAKAATAGVTETADASRGLVFVLNAFGKGAEDAEHVSDILFKTVDEGVISFKELSANIGDVAGPAALVGASFEDVGAALATLTKQGINASESVTSIRSLITKIIDPSEQATKVAESLGITLSKAGLEAAGGFNEFVKVIADATKGDVTKLQALFPEERAFRAISRLAGTASEEFQRLAGSFNNTADTAGATSRAFEIMNSTAENQFKLFKNNLSNAIVDVGTGLLNFLKPGLVEINALFDDTTPLEKTISKMRQLGVAAESIELANLRNNLIENNKQFRELAINLGDTIESFANAGSFLDRVVAGFQKRGINTDFNTGLKLSTEQFSEQLKTVQGLAAAAERRISLEKQFGDINNLISIAQASGNKKNEQALTRTKSNLEGQINSLDQLIGKQETLNQNANEHASIQNKIRLLQEFRGKTDDEIQKRAQEALKNIDDFEKKLNEAKKSRDVIAEDSIRKQITAQRDVVDVASEFVTVQKEATAASDATAVSLEKQKKLAEDAAKFIADTVQKLELFNAGSDIEKRLIAIRQEADERRNQFAGQAKAIEAVNKLERAERKKTIDDFEKQLQKEIKTRIEKIVKLDIQPKLITDLKLPEIELDEQRNRTIGDRINKELNKVLVESPVSILLNKITDIGPLLDDNFINFVGIIDKGLANFLSGLASFSANIASGNILGAITGAIGTLGSIGELFGGRSEEMQRIDEQQKLAAEEAAKATDTLRESFEKLSNELDNSALNRLNAELAETNRQITALTNSTIELTRADLDRLTGLSILESQLEAQLADAEARGDFDLADRLLIELESVRDQIGEFGFNIRNLTATELEQLGILLEQSDAIKAALEDFGKFADSFTGQIEKLNFKFKILNVDDPAEKLEQFIALIGTQFNSVLPDSAEGIKDFIEQGLAAFLAGGQTLIDFLKSMGLEELTADEFADLLEMMNQFANDLDDTGQQIGEKLSGILDELNLQIDLLDIEDATKKLDKLRAEIQAKFNAIIPITQDEIDALIAQGVDALLAGGDALKAFLASIDLEELTAEEFESLLRTLKGFADEAQQQIEEATDAAQEITTSQVKSITFTQGNKLIDEIVTMRVVLTQMLDEMRSGFLGNFSGTGINLDNLAAALTGLNGGARNNYFIVRDGNVESISENQLSEIDRRLIEQARRASQARGVS